jgi:hypothetical protein
MKASVDKSDANENRQVCRALAKILPFWQVSLAF